MGQILSIGSMAIGGIGGGLFVIKEICPFLKEMMDKAIFFQLKFDLKKCPRAKFAFIQEIKATGIHLEGSILQMMDGYGQLEVEIENKTYKLKNVILKNGENTIKVGNIFISFEEGKMTIHSCKLPLIGTNKKNLLLYTNTIYKKHNAPSKVMMFFTSNGDKWSLPIARQPRDFSKLRFTPEMGAVLQDVDTFTKSRQAYKNQGLPFKTGYLLHGPPGTGKSTCIEMVANKYNMTVYMLTLNDNDMTDTTIINLLSRVPPNSIIAIEEIDQQMVTLKKNKSANVSIGGLLSGLDGPQRLSDSVIVMVTANKHNFLSKGDMFALCRPGRIGKVFHLGTKLS